LKEEFETLYEQWYSRLFQLAYRILLNEELAQEATQRAFINIYRRQEQLSQVKNFRQWLYRIVLNCTMDILREQKRRRNHHPIQNVSEKQLAHQPDGMLKQMQRKELQKLFQGIFQQIPTEQRMVVVLKIYHNVTFEEIGKMLQISSNTAKSRFYRGIALIRQILEEKNLIEEVKTHDL